MKRVLVLVMAMVMLVLLTGCSGDDASWVCPACGQKNTGNFCDKDGTSKPVQWTCAACGKQGNTSEFCPQCGAANPCPVIDGSHFTTQVLADGTVELQGMTIPLLRLPSRQPSMGVG